MSIRRLVPLLPLFHVVLACILIGIEEWDHWHLHLEGVEWADRVGREERQHPQHTIQSKAAQAVAQAEALAWKESADSLPSGATMVIEGAELPAVVVVGWFQHSPSRDFSGFLQPLLFEATLGMPAALKVLLLDGLLILAIGAQWWFVGIWLRARERRNHKVKFQQTLAVVITIGAAVSTSLCRVGGDWEFFAVLASFGSAILWLILLSNAMYAMMKAACAWGYSRLWVRLRANG